MKPAGSKPFVEALRALKSSLDECRGAWVFIGGVAVIAHGIDRFTADIDATLSSRDSPEQLLRVFRRHDIGARIRGAAAFARKAHVLLLRHRPTGVDLDVSLAKLQFEDEAIAFHERKRFASETIPVARPEDLLVFKLIAGRPQDIDDAGKLYDLHAARIDSKRTRQILEEFSGLLEDPRPLEMFDALRRRRRKR